MGRGDPEIEDSIEPPILATDYPVAGIRIQRFDVDHGSSLPQTPGKH